MTRIKLKAAWIVGFDGRGHVLWPDGEVVVQGDRIVFVGRNFPGDTDITLDHGQALIGPGFIDLDALGDLDSTVLTFDNGNEWELGRIFTIDQAKSGRPEIYAAEEELFKYRYAFAQLIRNGITTALPITSMSYRAWAESYQEFAGVAAIAGELGLRTYLGPCYMSGATTTDNIGTPGQHWDEERGLAGLAAAERFIADFDGTRHGLIRAMLAPDRIETCTPALLARTAEIARASGVPVRLHCCQSVYEVELVKRLRGMTPYRWLDTIGLLTPQAVLPHGIYVEDEDDLKLLSERGASIAHCPVVFARDGEALRSFSRYRSLGINIGMGTDTFPPDMVDNMRQGLNICRVVEGRRDAASAAEFYTAATLNGARALRRDDIGKLSEDSKADVTVFDLSDFAAGPPLDPIKAMLLSGSGRDFVQSWIDGRCVMRERCVEGTDIQQLKSEAARLFAKLQAGYTRRAPGRPSAEQLFRPSFPLAG